MPARKKTLRVLVCGSRNWESPEVVNECLDRLNQLFDVSAVIHGACRGADTTGMLWARSAGKTECAYPADWKTHGRAAGPIRNQKMLAEGRPEVVLAFHDDLEGSKGTKDMVRRALSVGLAVWLMDSTGQTTRIYNDYFGGS